jgi:hypothetical protein
MKISHDIREDSLRQNGMEKMSATFKEQGGKLYVEQS